MVEYNIEVDENDNKIGLRPKKDFHTGKYIHRSSHLILFNSKREILLQQRASTKKWYPNLFTYSVSGSVANETYEECIYHEMEEEIGISTTVNELFKYKHFDEIDKAWRTVFVGESDEKINPDKREIKSIKWIDASDLEQDILNNPNKYTPPFVKGMKIFFSDYHSSEYK